MPAESASLMTAEELLAVDLPNKSTELVRGQLIVREPPSTYHGKIAARFTVLVGSFVYANELGDVFGQDTGFKIASNPDTVRAPDLAFVSRERSSTIRPHGYAAVTPDLVVEIVFARRSFWRSPRESGRLARRRCQARVGGRSATP